MFVVKFPHIQFDVVVGQRFWDGSRIRTCLLLSEGVKADHKVTNKVIKVAKLGSIY